MLFRPAWYSGEWCELWTCPSATLKFRCEYQTDLKGSSKVPAKPRQNLAKHVAYKSCQNQRLPSVPLSWVPARQRHCEGYMPTTRTHSFSGNHRRDAYYTSVMLLLPKHENDFPSLLFNRAFWWALPKVQAPFFLSPLLCVEIYGSI